MFKNMTAWSEKSFMDLPWRKKRTVYRTLVSEIMLQQTTVGTVINHFERFIKLYPNLRSLANTTEDEICIAWKGLGYYRRARNLRKAAIYIVENYKGKIPQEHDELLKINGVGEYTASAILSIGMDKPALAVDANLERVLSRIYMVEGMKGVALQKEIRRRFDNGELLKDIKKYGPRAVNEGLMDLGREICNPYKTSCSICPVKKNCQAYIGARVFEFPNGLKEKKISKYYGLDLLRIVCEKDGKIFGLKKGKNKWLSNQIELPTYIINSEDDKLDQYPSYEGKEILINELPKISTSITKYRIKNYILIIKEKDFKKYKIHKNELDLFDLDNQKVNHSTVSTKIFKKLKLI